MACLLFDAEEMQEGIAAKAEADRLQRNHFVGRDVSEIDIGAEKFDEPYLLRLLRRFPNDLFKRYFCKDLLDET